MFAGLPPSQDKHDIVRILKNGYDFQNILQNVGENQDKMISQSGFLDFCNVIFYSVCPGQDIKAPR